MSNRLGKGLGALFKDNMNFDEERQENEQIIEIDLHDLQKNPYQPRKEFDEEKIEELAQSIKEHGIFQPIIVTKVKDGRGYYIVAGERRYRACKKLNLQNIPAIVRTIDDQVMAEIALLENLQRENLSITEEAFAYKFLIDKYGFTQQEVAERIGKSRSHITNVLRVLNLPEVVRQMLGEGTIEFGHAKILAGMNEQEKILQLSEKIKEENLSVRAFEELLKEGNKPKEKVKEPKKVERNVNLDHLEEQLTYRLGTSIKIVTKDKGGKVVIDFSSSEDFNRLMKILSLEDVANLKE